jgi:serine protease
VLNRSPLLFLAAFSLSACQPAIQEDISPVLTDTEAYIERELLIAIDEDEDGSRLAGIQRDFGLSLLEHHTAIGVSRVLIEGPETEKQMADLVNLDDRVSFAEPNYIAVAASSDDPYSPWQWNLDRIGGSAAQAYGTGSGVTVAVLDTGVLSGGPDGIGHLLGGYDFYYGDSDPSDRDGHGTFVAGTIAQSTGNGVGVAGLAPGASILPVKVLSDQGYGDISAIANGITWASDQGAQVVNMSLGSAYPSQTLERACTYAYERGTVLVAATGNEFSSQLNYPAAYDTVIAVGATRADDSRAGYSNTGSGIDLMAPGGDLSRDQNGDGYADGVLQETIEGGQWTYTFWEGTSMAAPHVAAAAALVLAQGDFSPAEVYNILASTTRDLGSSGYDSETGYGLIHVEAAVALAASGVGSSPSEGSPSEPAEETPSSSSDTTAPEISGVTGWSDGSSFTVQWTTNEIADSYIDFDEYGVYGDDDLNTRHTLRFQAQQGMTFVFSLLSTDEQGNTAESGPWQISL